MIRVACGYLGMGILLVGIPVFLVWAAVRSPYYAAHRALMTNLPLISLERERVWFPGGMGYQLAPPGTKEYAKYQALREAVQPYNDAVMEAIREAQARLDAGDKPCEVLAAHRASIKFLKNTTLTRYKSVSNMEFVKKQVGDEFVWVGEHPPCPKCFAHRAKRCKPGCPNEAIRVPLYDGIRDSQWRVVS